jgi:putative ABC transport system substrate-binding protein
MQFDRLKRREFIALLGGTVAGSLYPPLTAIAQTPARMLRIGLVSGATPRTARQYVAIDERLRELGWVEGQNLAVEFVNIQGQFDRYGEVMQDLARRNMDIIVALGPEPALKAALAATSTIPIVMVAIDYDPLALGYVASLARPGGNITGLFFQQIELVVKRLQLMKDAFPGLQAATVFWDAVSADQWRAVQDAAAPLGLRVAGVALDAQPHDYERALAQVPPEYQRMLYVLSSPVFFPNRQRLGEFAIRHHMASMFVFRDYAEAEGLMSYGPNFSTLTRRAVDYIDRIAKGAKPADLPVEQPTKFEFVINVKTAKALDLTISPGVLAIADDVIE